MKASEAAKDIADKIFGLGLLLDSHDESYNKEVKNFIDDTALLYVESCQEHLNTMLLRDDKGMTNIRNMMTLYNVMKQWWGAVFREVWKRLSRENYSETFKTGTEKALSHDMMFDVYLKVVTENKEEKFVKSFWEFKEYQENKIGRKQ